MIGADDERVRALIDAAEPRVAVVYPARVGGTQIVHLCRAEPAEDGPPVMRAICPGGAGITAALVPVMAGETFIVCPACRSWALAAGIRLPRSS